MENTPKHCVELYSTKWSSTSLTTTHKQNALVLDLDETLIHAKAHNFHKSCVQIPVQIFNKNALVYILLRPGLREFLDTMKKYYTLYVYTASEKTYAETILVKFGLYDYFEKIFSRGYCYYSAGKGYSKDLQLLNLPLKRLVFIDDSEKQLSQNMANCLPIKPFTGDLQDNELSLLTPYLLEIAGSSDVRPVHNKYVSYMKTAETLMRPVESPCIMDMSSANGVAVGELPSSKPKIFLKGMHQRQKSVPHIPMKSIISNNEATEDLTPTSKHLMRLFQQKLNPIKIYRKSSVSAVISLSMNNAYEDSPGANFGEIDERVLQQNIVVKRMSPHKESRFV